MRPKKVRLVIVTMFDKEGDPPGELGLFLRRDGLEPVRLSGHFLNGRVFGRSDGLLAIRAGVGTANTAVAITALGLLEDFDFSEAYWLVAGIAGANPKVCSLGSPVWADWCVDGDLAWEIDPREMPEDWPTGLIPLGSKGPFTQPAGNTGEFGERYECFQLNQALVQWAFEETREVELSASPEALAEGAFYHDHPEAASRPTVKIGATLAAARFWHGWRMNDWAERWVSFWSKGEGTFYTAGMEDTGTLLALRQLEISGRVSFDRVMILRTASNFSCPPPGRTAAENLIPESGEVNFPGFGPALENGYRTASRIIQRIVGEGADPSART